MDNITQLIQAIQTHAWYSVAALALTLAILVWKQVQPQVWAKIPEKWQWVPAVVLAAVTAFVAAWQTGATVVQAVAVALLTLVNIVPFLTRVTLLSAALEELLLVHLFRVTVIPLMIALDGT